MTFITLLTEDGRWLFATRMVRMFAYGLVSVVLALYLASAGLTENQIGFLITFTLIGDTLIALWLTSRADRAGRRKTLQVSAGLMVLAGGVLALTQNYWLALAAATLGVLSPSGNEVGAFLPVEQAALTQTISDEQRTSALAWYQLAGSLATALGALAGGGLAQVLQNTGTVPLESYRAVLATYAGLGILLLLMFTRLTKNVEPLVAPSPATRPLNPGLHRSRNVVFKLATLFSLDAFGGALVVQSFFAYWFHVRYGVEPAGLGGIFFGANLLGGLSALAAASLAKRIGLINTMVFTHLPSNVLLMLVPLMPNLPLAVLVLLIRYSISQMDVPTRQSYTLAVVEPDERSAASGVTSVARTVGASFAPTLTGALLANPALTSVPFFLAGALKIIYDLALWRSFRALKPPEEINKG
ncbi:MAG: MFS transporter [Anaerolineales bacterium]|nr:MFS transporter [Anaerolineales bacterium]